MEDGGAPTVTVLITLYNKGAFVEEAVRSALSSSLSDIEVLVVDDGSDDGGRERVAQMPDSRVRLLVSAGNTGRPSAANRGLEAARGKYIAVMDADDRMAPDRLAKQVAVLEGSPDIGVVGSRLAAFGDSRLEFRLPSGNDACKALAVFGMPVLYPTCMFRREIIERFGIRCDPEWRTPGMDYLFMLRFGPHVSYANIPEVLTHYRVGAQNMRHGRDAVSDAMLLFTEVLGRLGLPNDQRSVRCHLILEGTLQEPLDRSGRRAVRQWAALLLDWTARTRWCTTAAISDELDKRFDRLFKATVASDPYAALSIMMVRGGWTFPKLRMVMAHALRRKAAAR